MADHLLVTLAWRNVWRHPRRTVIILTAIALGVWSMITLGSLTRGIMEQQVRDAIQNLTGHIQIHAPGYRDDPVVEYSMPAPDAAQISTLHQPAVVAWAARVRVPAVVASERESTGVTLVGIDPAAEKKLSFIDEAVAQGRGLDGPADQGILIGRKLAETLETGLGKRIVIMSQDTHNEIADRGFRVVGIFRGKTEAPESAFVFVGRRTAQKLLKMGDRVSEIAVLGHDRNKLTGLLADLRPAFPHANVETWKEIEPLLALTQNVYEVVMYIWFVVIFLAMSFGLVNTLLMAVFERTREIGLLQALGMSPRFIVGQVMLESVVLLIVGLVAGNLAAWATIAALHGGIDVSRYAAGLQLVNMANVMYPAVKFRDVAVANAVVLVLGLVAGFYPAWRAARYVPVDAITRT